MKHNYDGAGPSSIRPAASHASGRVDHTGTALFFSSRRRDTGYTGDWSSDVCSSDLSPLMGKGIAGIDGKPVIGLDVWEHAYRSEERRVGKECRSRWSPYH